jgi:hypothetical protein
MLTTEEKLELALQALRRIADFGHTEECCNCGVPVYECCCYDKSQWDIAREALEKLDGG